MGILKSELFQREIFSIGKMKLVLMFMIIFVAISSINCECDCNYHWGGCQISEPAQPGHVCKCIYEGFWTCSGRDEQCTGRESNKKSCEGTCTTKYCCIDAPGSDCNGYD